jgi:hypothetical protein
MGKIMKDESVEEFRQKIKKIINEVIIFNDKTPQKFNKQRRPRTISSRQARSNSGWVK